MNKEKILIAAPIGDGKEYSINEWFKWISEQPHENYEVCLCVNGTSEDNVKKKVELLNQVEICGNKIHVLELEYNEYFTKNQRLVYSREKIRLFAKSKDYDFIFWLDTDTIPLVKDAIPLLLATKKDVVSGLYFYKETRQPVLIDKETKTNMAFKKIQSLVETGEVIEVWGFGYGCLLMSKKVYSMIPFDYENKRENWSDDFTHCDLMEKANIKRFFYARVTCFHYHKKHFSVRD